MLLVVTVLVGVTIISCQRGWMCDEGGLWDGKVSGRTLSDLSFDIIPGNCFFVCNLFYFIGFSFGEEWENGCRWRWIGRGRG